MISPFLALGGTRTRAVTSLMGPRSWGLRSWEGALAAAQGAFLVVDTRALRDVDLVDVHPVAAVAHLSDRDHALAARQAHPHRDLDLAGARPELVARHPGHRIAVAEQVDRDDVVLLSHRAVDLDHDADRRAGLGDVRHVERDPALLGPRIADHALD